MNARSGIIAVAGLLLAAGLMVPARAKEPEKISLQTVYLRDPIEGYHHVAIVGELDGDGILYCDQNTCSVNEFGDSTICTAIGNAPVKVAIKDTQKSDPSKRGRKLYALEGAGLKQPLFLVVSPDSSQPARLVHYRAANAPLAIPLEPRIIAMKATKTPRD